MQDLDLAASLCSRLCHDLVGPVGAIGNGLELLGEESDPEMQAEALKLLGLSVDQAKSRLQFYRICFGAGAGRGAGFDPKEVRAAAAAFLAGGRVALDWPDEALTPALSGTGLKLLANLVLVASEAVHGNGTVVVRVASGEGRRSRLTVAAEGAKARLDETTATALGPDADPASLPPKVAPACLAAGLAADSGGLAVEAASGRVLLSAEVPAANA